MDCREEARERFDRTMRIPDRAIEIIGLILLATILWMLVEAVSPSLPQNDFLLFFWTIQIGIYACCGTYFVFRLAAAFVIAARVARRQRPSGGAGLHEDSPGDQKSALQLAVGM